ncbi:MAG: type III secretion system inner membrane ring subunit SctD [Chlamydiales bacterium]|nr:type III secretion system inner membrane ring subunit SctD [Chlamydiales bacterium]
MNGFLIAEEGPVAGLVVRMDEGDEWIIGRDPDVSYQVLEDPMVSRKAAKAFKTDEGFFLENLSDVNPTTVNGTPALEPTLLTEGDIVQIGGTLFRFTEIDPAGESPKEATPSAEPEIEEGQEELPPASDDIFSSFKFTGEREARWMIKVISGPNSGAEFGLDAGQTVVIGKDPNTCDITLQDLSVSRQHAKISVSEDGSSISIEDLGSRNGTLSNGYPIQEMQNLHSQDLIALGTTTFLVIDREQTRETIFSPPPVMATPEVEEQDKEEAPSKNWKQLKIAKHHLILFGLFAIFLLVGVGSMLSLFQTEPIAHETKDSVSDIRKALKGFPAVEFSFNETTGKLFILGHVLTEVDNQEMIYMIKTVPFITSIEDNVTIDELVWDNTNALLMKNPAWRSTSMTGKTPGKFLLRGYVETAEEDGELKEYLNLNFPYLDKLDYQVVVEKTLEIEIQSMLLQGDFTTVSMQLVGGDLVLAGRVPKKYDDEFEKVIEKIKRVQGIQSVKNLVIYTSALTSRINLTSRYRVTGTSKVGNVPQYVVVGGKILSTGDTLDGMTITAIEPSEVLLEKDGLKYQINYNEQ